MANIDNTVEDDPEISGYSQDFADEVYVDAFPLPPVTRTSNHEGDAPHNTLIEEEEYGDEEFAVDLSLTHDSIFSPKPGAKEGSIKEHSTSFGFGAQSNSLLVSIDDDNINNNNSNKQQQQQQFADSALELGDVNQYYMHLKTHDCMSASINSTIAVSVTTQCDILCTTNTVLNYVIEKVAFPLKDAMGHLPYKGRRMNRLTHWKKGETPWQKLKMTSAKVERNSILKDERDEFMIRLKYEQQEREMLRYFLACRIQALYRGILSRIRLDKRRMRPVPYQRQKKPKYKVNQTDVQDELCTLASVLNLQPIPGLCLISRGKASKRMKKIQLAAALRMQKFFKMITAKVVCQRRLDHLRYVRIHGAARTVARFFKSLKMRTFAYRCRVEKMDRAVKKLQCAARNFISAHRIRVLRRHAVKYRQMKQAAILLQRCLRKKYLVNSALIISALVKAERSIADDVVSSFIEEAFVEKNADLQQEFAVEAVTETIMQELLEESVSIEEECRIAIHLQKLAEEMRESEQQRLKIEQELKLQEDKLKIQEATKQKNLLKLVAQNICNDAMRDAIEFTVLERLTKEDKKASSLSTSRTALSNISNQSVSAILTRPKSPLRPHKSDNSVENTVGELSRYVVSEVINKSRPSTPSFDLAKLEVNGIVSTATTKTQMLAIMAASGAFSETSFDDKESSKSVYWYVWSACQSVVSLVDAFNFTAAERILASVDEFTSKDDSINSSFICSQVKMYRAVISRKKHEYAEARGFYNSALALYNTFFSKDHALAIIARNGIAACLVCEGKYSSALTELNEIYLILMNYTIAEDSVTSVSLDRDLHTFVTFKCSTTELSISKAQTNIDISRLHLLCGRYKQSKCSMLSAKALLDTLGAPGINMELDNVRMRLMSAEVDWEMLLVSVKNTQESNTLETLLDEKRNKYESAIDKTQTSLHDRHPGILTSLLRVIRQQIKHNEFEDMDHFLSLVRKPPTINVNENGYNIDENTKASISHVLAMTQRARGYYVDSIANAKTALALRRKLYGNSHCLVAESLYLLGNLNLDVLSLIEAKVLLDECLSIQNECFGVVDADTSVSHLSILETMYSIGRFHVLCGQYDIALEILHKVVDQMNEILQDNDIDGHVLIEMCHLEISEVLLGAGKFKECKVLIAQTGKSLMALTGSKHSNVADGLFILSKIIVGEGKYLDADKLFARTLSLRTEIFGEQHPLVGDVFSAHAENQRLSGYYADAMVNAETALKISVGVYPADSPRFAMSLFNMAQVMRDSARTPLQLEAALEKYKQAMGIIKASLSEESVQFACIYGEYGECQRLQKNSKDALVTLQSAIERIQTHFGKDHLLNAEFMRYYAHTLLETGLQDKFDVANSILEGSVLVIQSNILAKNHPSVMFSRGLLGRCHNLMETPRSYRTDESTPQDMIDDALDFFDKNMKLSEDHPWVSSLGGYLPAQKSDGDTIADLSMLIQENSVTSLQSNVSWMKDLPGGEL